MSMEESDYVSVSLQELQMTSTSLFRGWWGVFAFENIMNEPICLEKSKNRVLPQGWNRKRLSLSI